MALTVQPETEETAAGRRVATQRLYRTADDRVVFEGDPDAAFLLCGAGAEIPDGYDEPAVEAEPEPEKVTAEHAAKPVEPKTRKRR